LAVHTANANPAGALSSPPLRARPARDMSRSEADMLLMIDN
jgi:hypothetical protein